VKAISAYIDESSRRGSRGEIAAAGESLKGRPSKRSDHQQQREACEDSLDPAA
jgi:hypothetical protein